MVDTGEQITKNQHYVPQFYLRKFINSDGKLEILDCERRKLSRPRTPKNVCYEEFFYGINNEKDEISQVVEGEFKRIEDKISSVYDDLVRKIISFSEITDEDRYVIATLLSMLYLRGPYVRRQIKNGEEDLIKKITQMRYGSAPDEVNKMFDRYEKSIGKKISKREREKTTELAKNGDFDVETTNWSHLKLMEEMDVFRNLFFGKYWTVYITTSSQKFITSDNPVVEVFPDWAGKTFYGPDFLQRTHYFALDPNVLVVAKYPHKLGGKKVGRKTLYDNSTDNHKILELNFIQPRHAIEFVYSHDMSILQEILNRATLHDQQIKKGGNK